MTRSHPAGNRTILKHSTDKPWAELTNQIREIGEAKGVRNIAETFASFEATEKGRRNLRTFLEGDLAA